MVNGRDIVNRIYGFSESFISDILIPENNDFYCDGFYHMAICHEEYWIWNVCKKHFGMFQFGLILI